MKWHIREDDYGDTLCGRRIGIRWSFVTEFKRWHPKSVTTPNTHYCNNCVRKFNKGGGA